MTGEQVHELVTKAPFRTFELCLADGRVLRVEQPDLILISDDKRIATIFQQPDGVEYLDLALVVSARLRKPDLFDDSVIEA